MYKLLLCTLTVLSIQTVSVYAVPQCELLPGMRSSMAEGSLKKHHKKHKHHHEKRGPIGPIGPVGPRGLTGATGATGAIGATGLKGMNGLPGLPGQPGLQGATGLSGAKGIAGVTGATGMRGLTGATGAAGTPAVIAYGIVDTQVAATGTGTTARAVTFSGSALSDATYSFTAPSSDLIIHVAGTYVATYHVALTNTSAANEDLKAGFYLNGKFLANSQDVETVVTSGQSGFNRTTIFTVTSVQLPATLNVQTNLLTPSTGTYDISGANTAGGGITIQRIQ